MLKHLKILYVGQAQGFQNADRYYMIPQKLINGFTRLGHTVYAFSDRDVARYSSIFRSQKRGQKAMNAALIETVRDYQPELIVLGHCKNVTNETLDACRRAATSVRIIYRNVDPLHQKPNVNDIKQRVGHVDAIFVTTAGDVLQQFSHPDTRVSFMPNPVDPAIERDKAFANEEADIDLLFLGSVLRDQKDHRADTASKLQEALSAEMNLYIGGAAGTEDKVFGAKYMNLLSRSKMGLCISKTTDYYLYSSDRMSQYMGSGIMAFIPEGPRFEDVLGEGAFVSVANDEDLIEKVRYYHTHEVERDNIAQTGYIRIREAFHVEKVCQYMIETAFDRPHSQSYGWPTQLW
ncbi:MAG: glycosyltransferase [Pseudobdellovibrionaceae bacterium]